MVKNGGAASPARLRVLVVEDEPAASALLVAILEDDGYEVCAVADGPTALEAAEHFSPDLALLDGGLPGLGGTEVARRLRQTGDLPIVFVTAADSAEHIHEAFRMGADDYIQKPFEPEELSWRVRAVLSRSGHAVERTWECGDLVVDERMRSATRAGSQIPLTATEFKMLGVLVRNRTRAVPKGQLLGQVWGYDADDHLLAVHMSSLRHKLDAHGPPMIHTIRGSGYVMRPVPPVPGNGERPAPQESTPSPIPDPSVSVAPDGTSVDGLTGAYRPNSGFTELERDIARARRTHQPLALALVAVDGLKAITESNGHGAGDRMLVGVADNLRARLRSYDLIIRFRVDEFLCVLSGLSLIAATERLRLVRTALAEAPEHVSITVGLVEPLPGDSPEDAVARVVGALLRERER